MAQSDLDLERFRTRLREMRDSIRGEIGSLNDETRTAGQDEEGFGVTNHPADDATELFDRQRNLAVEAEIQRELDQIERALARIDAGTYGKCEACGQPIGAERLEARPAATLCIVHQRERDRDRFGGSDTQY